MNNKTFQHMIEEIRAGLSTVLYSKNLEFTVVRLVFLKYAIDNYVGANTVENMQLCARAQKMFAMKDIENGMETVISVLQYIDAFYGFNDILVCADNLDEYARGLFGEGQFRQRKNVVSDDFKTVMDILGSFDLEEKDKNGTIGKTLVEVLVENIGINSCRNSFSGEYTTRKKLSELASEILSVDKDEVFCDFTSGIGLSTIEITKESMPNIVNADINKATLAISAMLYIMYGYKNITLYCEDSLTNAISGMNGDKIFVDGPIAMRLEKNANNDCTDSSFAVVNRIIHNYLSSNNSATAVCTVPSSVLFTTKNQAISLKQELITLKMLKAVVALPPMWRGTNIGTNLLVISRNYSDTVMFINAAESTVSSRSKIMDITGETLLPENKIKMIVDAVTQNKIIPGFSYEATNAEIEEKGYNLLPAGYVVSINEEETESLEEIDKQLSELYSKLMG